MTTAAILGIVPGLQATALVAKNIPDTNFGIKKGKKPKKITTKKMVKTGVHTLVGIGLIKPTAQMINAL